jgi:hypothetical protein
MDLLKQPTRGNDDICQDNYTDQILEDGKPGNSGSDIRENMWNQWLKTRRAAFVERHRLFQTC